MYLPLHEGAGTTFATNNCLWGKVTLERLFPWAWLPAKSGGEAVDEAWRYAPERLDCQGPIETTCLLGPSLIYTSLLVVTLMPDRGTAQEPLSAWEGHGCPSAEMCLTLCPSPTPRPVHGAEDIALGKTLESTAPSACLAHDRLFKAGGCLWLP